MRIFILSVVAAVAIGLVGAYGLSTVQQSVAKADAGSSVRLDKQESVNFLGRES